MRSTRKLVLEVCEPRLPLAGNLTVSVTNGTLSILGDGANNGVSIQELDRARYFVSGFALSGSNTTVNGQSQGLALANVTAGMHVELNAGDDALIISNSRFRRNQLAAEFSGSASTTVPSSSETPAATVHRVTTRVPGNIFIDLGDGNDSVGFGARIGTSTIPHHLSGTIQVIGGAGNDHVIADRTEAFQSMRFDLGDGNGVSVSKVGGKSASMEVV
jgi:hypothetical protein